MSSAVQPQLASLFGDPWRILDAVLDEPLHPGGAAATEALLDRAGVDADTRLLDVGCGSGDALSVARERGARAVGLDRNPSGAARDAVRGDMTALPFQDAAFDVVLGECVLCLSSDLDRTVADVRRILKPGGSLAFSDVTVDGEAPTLPSPFDELLCLDGRRDQAAIRDAVTDAGFEIERERRHREDLLSMRDRIRDRLDLERFDDNHGVHDSELADSVAALDDAVEAGRIGYVSVVATAAE